MRHVNTTLLTLALAMSACVQEPDLSPPPSGPLLDAEAAYERMTAAEATEAEAYALGLQTVLWGMQWVKAGAALRQFTTPLPEGVERNPADPLPHAYNVFGHARATLTHEVRLVEAPNTETPYSVAVVDLNAGPVVVVHPDHGDRYFRTSVWDIFGETRTISQKKDGSHPKPHVLARHDWDGEVPEGMGLIRFRSRLALLAPHIALTAAPNDMENVKVVQDGYQLIALRDWGASNTALSSPPNADQIRPIIRPNTTTPPELLFFEMLGETLKDIALRDDEVAFARQVERIGLTAEDGFQYGQLDEATIAGLKRALLDGQSILEHNGRNIAPAQSGGTWFVVQGLTNLDDWLFRGTVGWKYVWGDLNSEILYPMARTDQHGQDFTGEHQYEMRFPQGQLPPARYWRITMYDLDGFLVDNPIKRYGIGNMAEQLTLNDDGSLTLYIQHESPGRDKEINWLPAPQEGFSLQMRMYQPDPKMYRGEYILPPVTRN